MKIAIVHDWLVTYAGAERALEQILHCFPEADLFAVIDFFSDEQRNKFLLSKNAKTTYIQKLPFAKTKYRFYLPFMPLAIEQLDLRNYDIIISSSHAVAKGVITGPNQLHISYVYSPMRYAWDLQLQYLFESNLTKGIKSLIVRKLLHKIRIWDFISAARVDEFVGISNFISRRIWKAYRREAVTIYPPVDTDFFMPGAKKENFYFTVSRLVPYKKIDLIVETFAKLPEKKLIIIGDGPQMRRIKKLANNCKNILILGEQTSEIVREHMQKAKAFIFASEEDFGIAPLEAQSCGTPVIAYAKGGCLETIYGLDAEKPTGVFFHEQTIAALTEAINKFESTDIVKPINCRSNALRFSISNFRNNFTDFIAKKTQQYFNN